MPQRVLLRGERRGKKVQTCEASDDPEPSTCRPEKLPGFGGEAPGDRPCSSPTAAAVTSRYTCSITAVTAVTHSKETF